MTIYWWSGNWTTHGVMSSGYYPKSPSYISESCVSIFPLVHTESLICQNLTKDDPDWFTLITISTPNLYPGH